MITIRESQIEDILATHPDITREILGTHEELSLLNRQKVLPSGNKLDLLFACGTKLILVELKVEPFQDEFIAQINGYREELVNLQTNNKLVNGEVIAYLLCPSLNAKQKQMCLDKCVQPIEYSPELILESFFARLKNLANFITLKPADHGLWNLHLLNRLLYALPKVSTKHALVNETGLSSSTISSYLLFAQELCLVKQEDKQKYVLTDLGKQYVWNRMPDAPDDYIVEDQIRLIQEFIINDPFATPAIFGIYTMVDVIFTLSKNVYPVPVDLVLSNFRDSSGKFFQWASKKAALDAVKMYSNYATELGLLGRIGDKFYLTPNGVRFILLLQLHKAIKMVDALQISTR
jgi:hypothetical protein